MSLILDGTNGLSDVDGTAATPAIRGTDTNTGIFFPAADTIAFSEGGVEAMRIDGSGNVGIGTSSPAAKLHVSGNLAVENSGGFASLEMGGASGAFIDMKTPFSDDYDFRIQLTSSLAILNTLSAIPITFGTNDAERMRIDSSGNLLVGTTNVNGRVSSVAKSGLNPPATNGSWANNSAISVSGDYGGAVSWIDGGGGYCAWVDDGGTDFNIAGGTTSSTVGNGVFLNGYAATSWSSRSDERLKDKIEPITDAINKVNSLRAVTGVYKNFPDNRQAFLFAQDVQAVLPEAVSIADKRSPEQYLGLAYTQVIPLLVASIKELNAKVDAQAARIAALENPSVES